MRVPSCEPTAKPLVSTVNAISCDAVPVTSTLAGVPTSHGWLDVTVKVGSADSSAVQLAVKVASADVPCTSSSAVFGLFSSKSVTATAVTGEATKNEASIADAIKRRRLRSGLRMKSEIMVPPGCCARMYPVQGVCRYRLGRR